MRSRLVTLVLNVVVIMLPVLLTVLLLTLLARLNLSHYIPSHDGTFNDGIYYWRQAYTFSQAGLDGGYYTLNELAAPARFSHFYFYGPTMPVIYGLSGYLFGWYPISLVVINHILVALGLVVFIITIRPSIRQLVILLFVLLLFWSLTFFMALTMQEGLHYTIAIMLAAGFAVLINKRDQSPAIAKILIFLLLVLASQLRIVWAFFFVPYFILIASKKERLILSVFKGLICAVLNFIPFIYMSAPYYMGFLSRATREIAAHPFEIISLTTRNILTNLRNLFVGDGQQLILRLQVVLLIVLCLFDQEKVQRLWKNPRSLITEFKNTPVENILSASNLIVVLLASIVLYEVVQWREIRTIAPHVLFTLLLLVVFRHFRLVFIIMAVGLLALPSFISSYQDWGKIHTYDEQAIVAFPESVKDILTTDATTNNAWCNTLLVRLGKDALIYPELMYIPPKIGISFFVDDNFLKENSLKSKYVLLAEDVDKASFDHLQLRLLKTTTIGNLYLNEQANCQTSG